MNHLEATPLQLSAPACILFHFSSLSLLRQVWARTKWLQGKLQRSKLVHLSSSLSRLTALLADTLLSTVGESESKAQTAYQLAATSPVAEKHSADQPIRTESTESATDRANRTGAIAFLPILITDAWENTEILWYSQTTSLTTSNSCLWVLLFFPNIPQKSYWCLPQRYQPQL